MATTYNADIQKLYVAYFNRPADVAGLNYWESVVEAQNGSTAAVAATFAASAEYKAAYANMDTYHVINAIYNNLFGHDADLPGLNYWAGNVVAGNITMDQAVTAIAAGAQGTDADTYANRVAAATAFTTQAATTLQGTLDYTGAAANAAAKAFLAGITDSASLEAAIAPAALNASLNNVANAYLNSIGQTFSLTTGVDNLVGTAGNDVFNVTTDASTHSLTLGTFDSINGAAGSHNALNIIDTSGVAFTIPGDVAISNIQDMNVSSTTAGATVDATGIATLTSVSLNTTDATATTAADTVKVNAGVAVSIISASGPVVENGGSSVTVNAKGAVTIGATTAPTGAVAVTTSNAGTPAGSTVADIAAGAVNIKGGSTVTVTENLVAPTVTASTVGGFTTTGGNVTVNGTADTTSVNVTQTAAVDTVAGVTAVQAVTAVTAATETAAVASDANGLAAGGVITVGGLTFTAGATALTQAQLDTVFANLNSGATTGGATALGTYSGTLTGWSTGAAANHVVTFTSTTANTNVADLVVGGAQAASVTVTESNGAAAVTGVTGVAGVTAVAGIIDGTVSITDKNSADTTGTKVNTITTVSLDGYGANSTIKSNALTSLSLADSAQNVTVTDNTAAAKVTNTTLNVTVNNLADGASLTDATIKTLNIASGADGSALAVNAVAATTVTVTGAGDLDLALAGAAKLVTFDGSGATGAISVADFGTKVTTALTGSGDDTLVLKTATSAAVAATATAAAIAAVNLNVGTGAGNDSIDVTAVTGKGVFSVNAGDGNDTITVNQAQLAGGNMVDGGAGSDTIVLATNSAALGDYDYVTINAAVSNVEGVEFSSTVALDASRLAFSSLTFDQGGTVSGVSTQTLSTAGNLTATAAGDVSAVAGTGGHPGIYAGNLNVTDTAASATLTLNADMATVKVKASTAHSAVATISGDLQTSLTVNLTNSGNATHPTGDNLASATINVSSTANAALKSIVLTGNGTVTIDDHAAVAADGTAQVALSNIDASQLGGTIANGTNKGAITGGLTFTGNAAIAETITLGSGQDHITVNSTYGAMDTIVGFDAVKEGSTSASTTDVLTINGAEIGGGASNLTLDGLQALVTGSTHVAGISMLKLAAGDSSLDLAFAHAATAATVGSVVEFQFGGNTYLFADTNHSGTVDNADFAIKLVGTVDVAGAFGAAPATA